MRVGFIGAGHRVQEYYLPIIRLFQDIELVGFWTRSQKTANQASQATGLKQYDSIQELARDVDLLITCLPPSATNVLIECVENTRTALLIETPIVSEHVARASYEARDDRIINVAENWPYRPGEFMKGMIVRSGLLGRPNVVVNDFRGYEYHGMAMMRSYFENSFPTSAFGTSFSFGPLSIKTDEQSKTLDENWDVGIIELENGGKMVHNFNSIHSRAKTRGPRSLRVMCANGCVSSDDLEDIKVWFDVDGRPNEADPSIEVIDMVRRRLEITVKGEKLTWIDPGFSLDDQQISIYSLISDAKQQIMNGEMGRIQPAWQGWIDWICVNSLRTSSAWAQKVSLKRPTWMK